MQKVAWQAKVGSVLFFNHLEAKKAEEDIFLRDIQFEMDRHTAAIKALNRMMMEDNYSANVDRV